MAINRDSKVENFLWKRASLEGDWKLRSWKTPAGGMQEIPNTMFKVIGEEKVKFNTTVISVKTRTTFPDGEKPIEVEFFKTNPEKSQDSPPTELPIIEKLFFD